MTETFILIPGRTSRQAAAIGSGRFADAYLHEVTTLRVSPSDMRRIGLADGDRVRITSAGGRQVDVAVGAAVDDELPSGVLFIAAGNLSSQLLDSDTHGTGMPTSKGLDVRLEKLG